MAAQTGASATQGLGTHGRAWGQDGEEAIIPASAQSQELLRQKAWEAWGESREAPVSLSVLWVAVSFSKRLRGERNSK